MLRFCCVKKKYDIIIFVYHRERTIEELNEQINIYEQDIEFLREQMRIRETGFEEDLLKIKQQATAGQRATVQENVDMIRLQREVKEKAMKVTTLQAKYQNLEDVSGHLYSYCLKS